MICDDENHALHHSQKRQEKMVSTYPLCRLYTRDFIALIRCDAGHNVNLHPNH